MLCCVLTTLNDQIESIAPPKVVVERLVRRRSMEGHRHGRKADGEMLGEGEERVGIVRGKRCERVRVLKHETKITRVTISISNTHKEL